MLMRSYVHRGIFKTKLNICDGAFFTLVKPYFKNILNQITFRFHFLHNSPFRKKLTTMKSLVHNGTIFFRNSKLFNGMASSQENEWRRFFKLASVKSVKTACVCIFFLHYFRYYGQNIFLITTVLYLIATFERKE